MKALEGGRIGVAAIGVGLAQGALDEALAYAKERRAFGQPIAKFQAIQAKIADISAQLEAARLLTYRAALKLDRGELALLAAAQAKLVAGRLAVRATEEAVQIHGGYGFIEDYPVCPLLPRREDPHDRRGHRRGAADGDRAAARLLSGEARRPGWEKADEAPSGVPFDAAACLARLVEQTAAAVRRLRRRGAVVAVSGGVDSGRRRRDLRARARPRARALPPAARARHRRLRVRSRARAREGARREDGRGADHGGARRARLLPAPRRRDPRASSPTTSRAGGTSSSAPRPTGGLIVFTLVVERPDGAEEARRLPPDAYRELISATNMKQRVRKLFEYTWADRLGYAVVGTPNLLEYDQGFFVKGGDGLADVKPIARLYKSQVYLLARELGLPEAIAERAPTTETFSLPQTQEEFYFGHPYERMDVLLWGYDHDIEPEELSDRAGLAPADVEIAYREIARRRVATEYLHAPPIVVDAPG